jgi:hypothetical protein
MAERICSVVRRSASPIGDGSVSTTVSIGVATRVDTEMVDAVMSAADRAVYEAKRSGRDRWVLAAQEDYASSPRQRYSQDRAGNERQGSLNRNSRP